MQSLHLVILTFGVVLYAGCNNPAASISEATETDIQEASGKEVTGTWRKTDGSLFILINQTKLVFYRSNQSLDNFLDYEFDGEFLTVLANPTDLQAGVVTVQEVRFEGYQMVLSPVVGVGYDGVFDRTGGF